MVMAQELSKIENASNKMAEKVDDVANTFFPIMKAMMDRVALARQDLIDAGFADVAAAKTKLDWYKNDGQIGGAAYDTVAQNLTEYEDMIAIIDAYNPAGTTVEKLTSIRDFILKVKGTVNDYGYM
jgi:hypothetical protein